MGCQAYCTSEGVRKPRKYRRFPHVAGDWRNDLARFCSGAGAWIGFPTFPPFPPVVSSKPSLNSTRGAAVSRPITLVISRHAALDNRKPVRANCCAPYRDSQKHRNRFARVGSGPMLNARNQSECQATRASRFLPLLAGGTASLRSLRERRLVGDDGIEPPTCPV